MAVYTVSVLRHGERGYGENIGRLWRSFHDLPRIIKA